MISIKTNAIKLQKGETIIEVIVATLVFAVGILGNLGLQSASVQSNKASLHQTKAILAANDIAERMRANREAALAGDYDSYSSSNPPGNPGCDQAPCSTTNIAQYHLFDWLTVAENATEIHTMESYRNDNWCMPFDSPAYPTLLRNSKALANIITRC